MLKIRKSLYSKTVTAMLLISLSIFITAAGILFYWFRIQMIKGYRQLASATIGNLDTSFSTAVGDTKSLAAEWYYSTEGVCLRLDPDADFVRHMSFVNKITDSIYGNSYTQSFCLINAERETSLYIATSVCHPENFEESFLSAFEQNTVRNTPFIWKTGKQYSQSGEELVLLSISIADVRTSGDYFSGIAAVTLDLTSFQKALLSDDSYNNFRLMILDSSGRVVIHSNPEYIGEDWSDREWVREMLTGKNNIQSRDSGGQWEFLYRKARLSGYYVVVQSDYGLQSFNIRSVLNFVILVILISAAAIMVMMLLVSRRIFLPFTSMVKKLQEAEGKHQADEEDAEALRNADDVAFLGRYYSGMASDLSELKRKQESDFIMKNLLAENRQTDIETLLHKSGALIPGHSYREIMVLLRSDSESLGMQEYDTLRSLVSRVYRSVLECTGTCSVFEVGLRRILFLFSPKDSIPSDKEMLAILAAAQASVQKLSSIDTACVCSRAMLDEADDPREAFGCLKEFLKTREVMTSAGTAPIIGPVSYKGEIEKEVARLTGQLAENTRDRDTDAFRVSCQELEKITAAMEYTDMLNILDQAAISIQRAGKLPYEDNRRALADIKEVREISEWFEALFDRAAAQSEKAGGRSAVYMMDEAVDYIRNHYDNPELGVNLLADRLNISTAYFGRLFQDFAGMKTLDYILKIRMEKAANLLLTEQKMGITQIAAAVGYNNSTYFTTAFKKYYGTTPSLFREAGGQGGISE